MKKSLAVTARHAFARAAHARPNPQRSPCVFRNSLIFSCQTPVDCPLQLMLHPWERRMHITVQNMNTMINNAIDHRQGRQRVRLPMPTKSTFRCKICCEIGNKVHTKHMVLDDISEGLPVTMRRVHFMHSIQ